MTSILLSWMHPALSTVSSPRMVRCLDSMWISHVRMLAQALHEALYERNMDTLPFELVKQARIGVGVLLSNMVLLGSTQVSHTADPGSLSHYHIPPFATLCFVMAEKFVQQVGFDGDKVAADRESIFAALNTFQLAMIVCSEYLTTPCDAPGFSFNSVDPFVYGVGNHTKPQQAYEVETSGWLAHQFGTGLERYKGTLGTTAYRFPVCPPQYRIVETAPNSPVDSSEMEETGAEVADSVD
ncbi:hypothetical protein MVEN_00874400 [Mycena venus]|uniref:Uncharacterized protein n=1 Tax=Mycena venus TaxID=2733690 RepID=A0A8H7D180_9AGAR|nr:hypothetical protein MVEN_00874400 [Mycena venus]